METENEFQSDPEVQTQIEEELNKMEAHYQALISRVNLMQLIHEDLIIVQKIDVRSLQTALHLPDTASFDRLRLSCYGKVLKISQVDSNDEVKEAKKNKVKVGDYVSFNPESAYSLNITVPVDMPEIWVLSIENILVVDSGFDSTVAKKKSVEFRVMMERARSHAIQAKMDRDMQEAKRQGVIT